MSFPARPWSTAWSTCRSPCRPPWPASPWPRCYAPNGWVGQYLTPLGIKAAYNPVGVIIALTFIGLPFVVRTLEPVMRDLSADVEEAAASLGARRSPPSAGSSCPPWARPG